MAFVPYIHFQGQCREAMAFYADVFGGTLEVMTYAEAPEGACAGGRGRARRCGRAGCSSSQTNNHS